MTFSGPSHWLATHAPGARVVFRATELATLLTAAQPGSGLLVAHAALRPVARVAAVWGWLVSSFAETTAATRPAAPMTPAGAPRGAARPRRR